jgi:hypothetical protein
MNEGWLPGFEPVVRRPSGILAPIGNLGCLGIWHGQIVRDGKIIDEWEDKNIIVNEGLDHILGVEFTSVTQITTWYMAPFEGNYTPVATDTAAVITANSTETTAYTASTRQTYVGVEASQSVTNSASPASFTFNATKTIYGAFLVSASAKSATSGKLFAAAAFSASKSVVNNDILLLTYTFNASSI